MEFVLPVDVLVAESFPDLRTKAPASPETVPVSAIPAGLMGLDIGPETRELYASKLADRCREAGLLVSADEDNLLTLFPALTIDHEVARQGLDILESCL